MRKFWFAGVLILLCGGLLFLLGELLVRWLNPQATLYPRYQFSPEYGMIPFADTTMIHAQPGHYRFTYRINQQHHRGSIPSVSNAYTNKNIVILGDSYSFGMGVQDGEEYPAVLQSRLGGPCSVVNLAAPGWGLTQQIRRFYELGQLYQPRLVILQFCRNDLEDNLVNRVTVIEQGRFQFRNSDNSANRLKKYLSRSILQRSQLYNFFRQDLVARMNARAARAAAGELKPDAETAEVPADQQFYAELLDLFAADLTPRGCRLILIAPGGQLDEFAYLKQQVLELQNGGLLRYLDVKDWLEGAADTPSPEGHVWGAAAHAQIGQHLARLIESEYQD